MICSCDRTAQSQAPMVNRVENLSWNNGAQLELFEYIRMYVASSCDLVTVGRGVAPFFPLFEYLLKCKREINNA